MSSVWTALGLGGEGFFQRFAANLVLFYGLLLAAGLIAGLVGAVAGDGAITGQSGTVVYAAEDPPVVETPNDDPQPGLLLAIPMVALYMGTLMLLPMALIWLGLAELLGWIGAPVGVLRGIAVGLAMLLASVVLSNGESAGYAIFALGMVAYAALCRLPPQPSLK